MAGILNKDNYGKGFRPFVGVVKDVDDPLNSNRVRVAIMGVHSHDLIMAGVGASTAHPGSGSSGSGSTGAGGGSSGSGGASIPSAAPIDESKLPTAAQLNQKLDDTSFTLGMLTTNVMLPKSGQRAREGIAQGKLTKEVIKNLAVLAKNALQPIKDKYGAFTINSAWRPLGTSQGAGGSASNHPPGYAADIYMSGTSAYELATWINSNIRGRFTMLLLEYRGKGNGWVHIQYGGKGSLASPVVQTYLNDKVYGQGLHRLK